MSRPAIKNKTNLPNAPEADSIKSPSLEAPSTRTLRQGSTPARSPHSNTDRAPDDVLDTTAESSSSSEPKSPPIEQWPDFDQNQGPSDDAGRRRFDIPLRSDVQNATIDASESSNSLGFSDVEHNVASAPGMPPAGHGAGPLHSTLALGLPAGHGAGPYQRRRTRAAPLSTFNLPPAATEDAESNSDSDVPSMAAYAPTAENLPHDENVPISPGPAVESPQGESHTFNFTRSDDAYEFRAHTVGTGPDAPGLTSPLRPRFPKSETEYARSLADERYILDEGRERTSRGNGVAIKEAREAGVQQRDFAPVVERPRNSRVPDITIPQRYDDPEEMDMVDVHEAMEMQQQQELRFAESWEDEGFWRLWNLMRDP
jgi:hypothetical protein